MKQIFLATMLAISITFFTTAFAIIDPNMPDMLKIQVFWEEKTNFMINESTAPICHRDNIYFSNKKSLYCLSKSTGQKKWEWTAKECFKSVQPGNSHVLINQEESTICLDATKGKKLWQKAFSFYNPPFLLDDQAIIKANSKIEGVGGWMMISLATGNIVWRNDDFFNELDIYHLIETPMPSDNSIVFIDWDKNVTVVDILTGKPKHTKNIGNMFDNQWLVSNVLYKNNKLFFIFGYVPHETSYGYKFVEYNETKYWAKLRCFDLVNKSVVWTKDICMYDNLTRISFVGDFIKTASNELYGSENGNQIKLINPFIFLKKQEKGVYRYVSIIKSKNNKLDLVCRNVGKQQPLWLYHTESVNNPEFKETSDEILLVYKYENFTKEKWVCLDSITGKVLWKSDENYQKILVTDEDSILAYIEHPRQKTITLELNEPSTGKSRWAESFTDYSRGFFTYCGNFFYESRNWLLCFGSDNKSKLWDLDFGDQFEIQSLKGDSIVVSTKDSIYKVYAKNGKVIWSVKNKKGFHSQITILGNYIFAEIRPWQLSDNSPNMAVWDLNTGSLVTRFFYPGSGTFRDMELSYMKCLDKQKGSIRNEGEIIALQGDYMLVKHSGYGAGNAVSCFNIIDCKIAWEFREYDIRNFESITDDRVVFSNYGKIICLDLPTGQTLWTRKIYYDHDYLLTKVDDFGNIYCIGNTSAVSDKSDNNEALICIDGQTGDIAYTYKLRTYPNHISVSDGLAIICYPSSAVCLKDWNYGREKPKSNKTINPFLVAGLTLVLILLSFGIRFFIQRKKLPILSTLYKSTNR